MWRAWPNSLAKTAAQKPAGHFKPLLSLGHALHFASANRMASGWSWPQAPPQNKSISRQPSGCCADKSGYRVSMESMLLCVGVERLAGDEEAVYEITGRVGRAHGLECSQVIHKILSFFCGERPKEFAPDHIQTEIPGFRALTRQILPVDDLQTTGNGIGFVVVHSFDIHIHSPVDWLDKLARLRRGKARSLEPVGEREGTARFQKARCIGEETPMIVIVGDGLDRPKKVKLQREIQGFGVHQQEPRVQLCGNCRLPSHFHLHWGDCDARRARLVLLCQVKAAGPEATTDIEHRGAGLDIRQLCEVLRELELRYFFRFVAANPITMMQMFAPKRVVVGADEIIVLDNFLLVVVAQRVGRLHAEWLGAHGFCAWMTSPRKNVTAGRGYIKKGH